jgi:glycosyltransferase involved in cell wall biosynthesis
MRRSAVSQGNSVSISVLTPTYQSGTFLPGALASVAGADVRHVVMDGGSSDGTVALLEAAPAVTWRSEPDRGQSDALNKAIAVADGEWLGWLNADEFYLPGVLDFVRRRLARDDVDVLFGDFAEVDTEGRLLRLVTNHRFSPSVLRHGSCYLPSCATFLRRELVEQVGGWREERRMMMDWDLWLRLLDAGARFGYEPVVMAGFTRHPDQVTEQLAGRRLVELAEMRRDLGIVTPPWRHYLARAQRIALKALNGSYLREIRARAWRGAPLTGAGAAPVNPGLPVPGQPVG